MTSAPGFVQEPTSTGCRSLVSRCGFGWRHLCFECHGRVSSTVASRYRCGRSWLCHFMNRYVGYGSVRARLIRQAPLGGTATSSSKPYLRCNLPCMRYILPGVWMGDSAQQVWHAYTFQASHEMGHALALHFRPGSVEPAATSNQHGSGVSCVARVWSNTTVAGALLRISCLQT